MNSKVLTPTVAVCLRPVAYQNIDPVQRAAWDSFWLELFCSVREASYRPGHEAEGGRESQNQHRRGRAVSKPEPKDDIMQPRAASSDAD